MLEQNPKIHYRKQRERERTSLKKRHSTEWEKIFAYNTADKTIIQVTEMSPT